MKTRLLLAAWLCLLHLPTQAAGKPGTNANAVAHVRTAEYTNRVQTLKVQPAEAWTRLLEYRRVKEGKSAPQKIQADLTHSLLVGDSYHFHLKQKTGGIPLTGYYVDGQTGAVEFRKLKGRVPYPGGN